MSTTDSNVKFIQAIFTVVFRNFIVKIHALEAGSHPKLASNDGTAFASIA